MIELFFELSLIALVLGLMVLLIMIVAFGFCSFFQLKKEHNYQLKHKKELTEKKENGNTQN